jgi:hypothetical protein
MKMFRDEAGQTLVFTAFLMCCLFGFMALALDMGVLFRAHRRIQTAADAGAVAAGLGAEYNQSSTCSGATPAGTASTSVKCAAANAAAANGVPGSQLTVNQPPSYGYHVGPEYIEVMISQPNPTVFMGAFSGTQLGGGNSNFKAMTVASRAVSGIVPGQNCMIALNPHVADAVDVQGNATINTPNCSVQVNSDNDTALCSTGAKATIDSVAINIVGAQNPKGKCNKGQPNATTGVAPVPNPFGSLQQPSCAAGNTFSVGGSNPTITAYNSGSGAVTLTNKAGTSVTATPSKQSDGTAGDPYMNVVCFSDTNLQIASGLILGAISQNEMFVFTGNVTLGGTVTINGTMDIAGAGTLTQGNQILNVVAPTSDQNYLYNGIALYYSSTADSCDSSYKGPDTACFQAQFGSGFGHLDGMVYAPNAAVYLQDSGGNSGPTVFTAVIADVLWDKSALLEITNNYNFVHTTSPLNHVALVE